jgi:hypothetical protein
MKPHILIFFLIGFLCLMSNSVFGQISEGGTPISYSLDIGKISVLTMPQVDAKALLEEDEKNRANNALIPAGADVNVRALI